MVLAESTVKHLAELKNLSHPSSNYVNGILAEIEAAAFFLEKNYCIRAHRLILPTGEVDLLLENSQEYLMLEVKRDRGSDFSGYRISKGQISRIQKNYLFMSQYLDKPLSFEYVTVNPVGNVETIEIVF